MPEHYADRLERAAHRCGAPIVVGIDPLLERLPAALRPRNSSAEAAARALESFAREAIRVVAPLCAAVKINSGFFEALQAPGVAAYYRLVAAAHACGALVIGDVKRGDIGSTAALYARGHLDRPAFRELDETSIPDAVTLAGYLGENAVRPFVEIARTQGKGVYVLVRPSDPGADEVHEFGQERRFYEHMAALVDRWGAADPARPGLIGEWGLSCVGAVVAPKDTESTARLRAALPHTPWLVPGYGAQGGTADACRACFLPAGRGAVVNASRSVLFAFENKEYASRYGADWARCIEHACRDFAADIRRAIG